jgi:hypothetical protein
MKLQNQIGTAILIVTLCGCEGSTEGDGYVFDGQTGKPLDSVLVKSFKKRKDNRELVKETYSDSSGYFHGTTGFGGCQPCPDLLITLSKNGYTTIEIVNPDNDTVYLER